MTQGNLVRNQATPEEMQRWTDASRRIPVLRTLGAMAVVAVVVLGAVAILLVLL